MRTAVCTGGRKYKVALVNSNTGVDVCLNNVLLERNLAVPDNIEQVLENLNLLHSEDADATGQNDVEPEESQIIEHSGINMPQHPKINSAPPSAAESILNTSDDEGYDIVIDDLQEFVMGMLRVSTLFISISCLEMTINSFLLPGVEVHIFLKC